MPHSQNDSLGVIFLNSCNQWYGVNMSFKIVVDSCCELPEEYLQDSRFEIVRDWKWEITRFRMMRILIRRNSWKRWQSVRNVPSRHALPRAFQGSLPHRSRACVCDHFILPPQRKLQQCGAWYESVSGKNGKKQIHVIDSESAAVVRPRSWRNW